MAQITIVIDTNKELDRRRLNNLVADSHQHIHKFLQYQPSSREYMADFKMGESPYTIAIEIKP